mmetsp:Transcript_27514/g.41638  ORF Transcript_27514/g.41638 Transcript_27514/m.41638 type:complete len:153 (+) Transcript_27514:81-539(+)
MVSTQATDNIYFSLGEEIKPSTGLREWYNKRQVSNLETKDGSESIKADNADDQEESIEFHLRPSCKDTEADSKGDNVKEESIVLLLNPSSHNEIFLASSFNRKLTSICENERCEEENGNLQNLQTIEEQDSSRNDQQNLLKKVLTKRALKKN